MKLPRTIRPAPILAAVLSLCLAGYLAVWPALGYTADRPLPIYCVDRPEKVCAISFDAAWGADNTQGILDVLAKYNVKATFFVVGNWADQYPQQAKAIVESGCELMNHSNAHGHFNSMSTAEIQADVTACNDKIEALTGVRPTLIRCPFGEYDDHVITAIREAGGAAVLAHPGNYFSGMELASLYTTFNELCALGLGGIEAYYPTHSKIFATQTALFCEKKGLLITSGSDDHGLFAHTDGWQQYHIGCQMMEPHRLRLGNLAPEE